MKGLVTAEAIEKKVANYSEILDCGNGEYLYGHNLFHDWKPFHQLSVTETVMQSSNICGVKIGEKLGAKKLSQAMSDFDSAREEPRLDFPEAMPGDIPSLSQINEEEYVGSISTGSILQANLQITPLEMLQAYGAIANGGNHETARRRRE